MLTGVFGVPIKNIKREENFKLKMTPFKFLSS
jgi:hypothetical protein